MATKAKLEGNKRYLEKLDDIKIRVPKGKREQYKAFAEAKGTSLTKMVIELIEREMSND